MTIALQRESSFLNLIYSYRAVEKTRESVRRSEYGYVSVLDEIGIGGRYMLGGMSL